MEKIEGYPEKFEEPDLSGTYSARDYLSWKTRDMVELIGGKIFKMSPAPTTGHQGVARQLLIELSRRLMPRCTVFHAPLDVYLVRPGEDWKQTKNIVQPDLCVICDRDKIHEMGCIGSPDLVVEVLSPSTRHKDLGPKHDLYEEYGVKELWIVHPNDGTVAVHVLESGRYRVLPLRAAGHILESPTFVDLKIDLGMVFQETR